MIFAIREDVDSRRVSILTVPAEGVSMKMRSEFLTANQRHAVEVHPRTSLAKRRCSWLL